MKIVEITAMVSGCGRSTLALNFAAASSWKRGKDVLLLDLSYGDPKIRSAISKYGFGVHDTSSFVNLSVSLKDLIGGAIRIPTSKQGSVLILPAPSKLSMLESEFNDTRSREELLNLQTRVDELKEANIDLLVLTVPPYLLDSYLALNYLSLCDAVIIITTENPTHLRAAGRSRLKELFCCMNTRTGVIVNFFVPPSLPSTQMLEEREARIEKSLDAPVISSFPFIPEFIRFPIEGIAYIERHERIPPWNELLEVTDRLESSIHDLIHSSIPPQPRTQVAVRPVALFVAEAISGRTIFSHFFGRSEQNPALVTASMVGVANIVSESAGRTGELRMIDNGNMKILVKRGRHRTMGILYCSQSNNQLLETFEGFIKDFEDRFRKQISVLKRTGIVNELLNVKSLVEERFRDFEFHSTAVRPELVEIIEEFARERGIDDPESAFQAFIKQDLTDTTRELLEYEYTDPSAHERHKLLAEASIRPSPPRIKELEESTGHFCRCWLKAEIRPLDIFAVLSLPEHLHETARSLLRLSAAGIEEITPELSAKETSSSPEEELAHLEELAIFGYLRKEEEKIFSGAGALDKS